MKITTLIIAATVATSVAPLHAYEQSPSDFELKLQACKLRALRAEAPGQDAMEFMRVNCKTDDTGRAIGEKRELCQAMLDEWQQRMDANAAVCMEKVIRR
jgi:hypothetical protein